MYTYVLQNEIQPATRTSHTVPSHRIKQSLIPWLVTFSSHLFYTKFVDACLDTIHLTMIDPVK